MKKNVLLRRCLWFLLVCCIGSFSGSPMALAFDPPPYDIVIYGGTSAAVTSAIQAKKMGKSVVIVCPEQHLGGLTSGGLGWTDTGKKDVIGGLSREFYQRVWRCYQAEDAWRWELKEAFGDRNQSPPGKAGGRASMWVFEPHVAEAIFDDWLAEHGIPVVRDWWLDRTSGVTMQDNKIVSIRSTSGAEYVGKVFIDATYEGDLLAAAGCDFHIGRESNSTYGEQWNGVQVGVLHHQHHFREPVDPYVQPGNPKSGLLPLVSNESPREYGQGDQRIQAYCFRMCLTNSPENRIPFLKPLGYEADEYRLLLRVFDTGWREMFNKFDRMPNLKTDTNNHGPVSTDYIGMNYDYPVASYQRRNEIIADHQRYQQGLLYFMSNDPRVPQDVREQMSKWGLAADEFRDNRGWPHQIYVREARRLIGEYVMTEHDCLDKVETPDSIGMGSYTLDSHNVQRYVKPDGFVQNEGDIGVKAPRPYEISLGSILPKHDQCENLLVPVCVSSSHIAFGSIRMEPVFMILGQSAATVACVAIDGDSSVQNVDYDVIRKRLLEDGQVLEQSVAHEIDAAHLPGTVVDDSEAIYEGKWQFSSANRPFVDAGYHHDENSAATKEIKKAVFETELKPGRYRVALSWPRNANRSSKVLVSVVHASGITDHVIDQTSSAGKANFHPLGTFEFGAAGRVVLSSAGSNGHVIADAVQFLAVE